MSVCLTSGLDGVAMSCLSRSLRQAGREVKQTVALRVPQIKDGVVVLFFFKVVQSVDIPVPSGMEAFVEAVQEVVKLVPQLRVQRSFVEHVTVPQISEEAVKVKLVPEEHSPVLQFREEAAEVGRLRPCG